MWRFKDSNLAIEYNKQKMAEKIGLAPDTVRRVIKGTQVCSKQVAYCITKFLNSEAEIEDYFEKQGESYASV